MIVNVKEITQNRKQELKNEILNLNKKGIKPKLAIIKASFDKSSDIYISKKRELCRELGILEEEYIFEENVTNEDVISVIEKLNSDENVDGILVQLPLYKHLNESKIIDSIDYNKDVDGLSKENLGKLVIGSHDILPCTPKGIMTILDSLNIEFEGKNATVIGRSTLVGKPISYLLLERGATVTTCHSKTKDLKEHTKNADILVVAVGKPGLVTSDMVKKGSIVIDVGITRTEEGIKGDVLTEQVSNVAKYVTPVPGGVGLTTVVSLMENVIEISKKRANCIAKIE